MKKRKNLKRIILFLVISVFTLTIIILFYSFFIIYKDVKSVCLKAQNEYKKECVNALIKYIQSDNHTLRTKNSAVWTLGQLADKKALPFLYELYKSLPKQEKCNYDHYLCKYEVQKAIKWCKQGNITSWMYRDRGNWR